MKKTMLRISIIIIVIVIGVAAWSLILSNKPAAGKITNVPEGDTGGVLSRIVASIIEIDDACACIPLSEALRLHISREGTDTEFREKYDVGKVDQVLYNDRNELFAVTMTRIDGLGNKLFIVEYKSSLGITDIMEVPHIVSNSDTEIKVVGLPGFDGYLLQVYITSENESRVKLIAFDKEFSIIGEYEVVDGYQNSGYMELQEIFVEIPFS